MTKITKDTKIYIAGNKGMVGSACWRLLEKKGYKNLIGKSSKELDLKDQQATAQFFKEEKPQVVIDAAAKVGGIWANSQYPYEFLMDNMLIQNNLISSSLKSAVKKFIFLGSSCIYPKMAPQPLKEEYLLSGPLEPTNQWYSIAKISGVKLIEAIRTQFKKDYVALMPTNLYGPGDNYDLETSHVLPAMIRKFHEAKENNHAPVTLWGSGTPFREFLHVDDLAKVVVFSMENSLEESLYNVGSGKEISIKELALLIQKIVGHNGGIIWNTSMPDGTTLKLLDTCKLEKKTNFEFIALEEGIIKTYKNYLDA